MCGIAGIVRLSGLTDTDQSDVRRMSDRLVHRGPDDAGFYSDHYCALGHRRLSVIDLSEDGRQPFPIPESTSQIVFNGEIYNYLELRAELIKAGFSFRTNTDTEVLAVAFRHWGLDCLDKLNGMFAIALWDAESRRLHLIRDHVGIKPLYYSVSDEMICFASEPKALEVHAGFRRSVNLRSIFDYLVFNRTDVAEETFYTDVFRVQAGGIVTFDCNGLEKRTWWQAREVAQRQVMQQSRAAVVQETRDRFDQTLHLEMRSDVPVGTCLSGGLDSSMLVGGLFSNKFVQPGFKAFTASFPGFTLDETSYVDSLSERYPIQSIKTIPTSADGFEQFQRFSFCQDEPVGSASFYTQFEVMRLAAENDVTVLLDGQGGDEVFAGYQYFHAFYVYELLRRFSLPAALRELYWIVKRRQHTSAYTTVAYLLAPRLVRSYGLKLTHSFLTADFFNEYVYQSKIFEHFFAVRSLNESLVRHFEYKLEHLLRSEDRSSMHFSLEARVPYLNRTLVEYVLPQPSAVKIRNGETRVLQREALGDYTIPAILDRTDKIGFGTPFGKWMQEPGWQDFFTDRLRSVYDLLPGVLKSNTNISSPADKWRILQLAEWLNR